MKIYIVTSGEYSDYHIEAVFTDEEQAQLYCATHYDCDIEEWEADEIKITPVDIYVIYEFWFDDKFNGKLATSRLSIKREKEVQIFKNQNPYFGSNPYKVTVPVKRGTPEEKAVKIARDYLFQYLMEQIENEKAELALLMEASANGT